MKSRQILIFATLRDIEPVIMSIESGYILKYYEMGLFDSKYFNSFNSISEIPNFGFPKFGDWNRDLRLMAMAREDRIAIREVSQKKGGVKFAIDQLENKNSICFQFGGIFKKE